MKLAKKRGIIQAEGGNSIAEKKAKPAPKVAAKKVAAKKKVTTGESYACEVCGLVVSVDEVCGCVDVCDIVCCGQPMKAETVKVKVIKK